MKVDFLLLVVEFYWCQSEFFNDCSVVASYSKFCDFAVADYFE